MSFINKPGKTTAWRNMVIRQQVSDVIAYGKIETTLTKSKDTQKHVDKIITLAKNPTLANQRKIRSIILPVRTMDTEALMKKLATIAKKNEKRNGGYTRVIRISERQGDNTQIAILQLV